MYQLKFKSDQELKNLAKLARRFNNKTLSYEINEELISRIWF